MAVDDPNVIDILAMDRSTGETVLTIADHLEWDAQNEHLRILFVLNLPRRGRGIFQRIRVTSLRPFEANDE